MEAWTWINQNWEHVVAAIGGIVIAARIIVKLTPTPKDDSFLEKIVSVLKGLGLKLY